MVLLDKERARKEPATESELVKKRNNDGMLSRAQQIMDEQLDDVKRMN